MIDRPTRGAWLRLSAVATLVAAAGAAALLAPGFAQGVRSGDGGARASLNQSWESAAQGQQILGGTVRAGQPTLQRFRHEQLTVTVTISPARPGRNLVRLDTTFHAKSGEARHNHGDRVVLSVGTDPKDLKPVERRPGTDGLWAVVDLPEGASTIYVSHGPTHRIGLPVETSSRGAGPIDAVGPDGPECLAAVTGRILAGDDDPVTSCPADRLTDADRRVLADGVDTLVGRGVEEIALLGDDTPRSDAASAVVRDAAAKRGVEVVDPDATPARRNALVVVAGWQTAADRLAAWSRMPVRTAPIRGDGTWLAPWLLSPGVVDSTAGAVLPLGFDIRGEGALRYREALETWLPDQAPTASGYLAWLGQHRADHRGDVPVEQVHLYAASRAAFMPPMAGHESHETTVAWFPGGTITPVAASRSGTLGK